MSTTAPASVYASRIDRVRAEMSANGVDALVLSVGHDLPYFTGYHAMPLERLTLLVLLRTGTPVLVIPRLEAPRVVPMPGVFELAPWNETDDPVALAHSLLGDARTVAVGDQMWSRFLVDLITHRPGTQWVRSVTVTAPLRTRKDRAEIDALAAAA
ncbi:MAG: hypothetical protein RI912_1084, partial [Actinomycetota bacterium]